MIDVSKKAVNLRLLARVKSYEENGFKYRGYHDYMHVLLITKQYKKFYELLRGTEIPDYTPKIFSPFRLIHVLQNMPAGKRKYILLHKRTYDLYKTEGPYLHDELRFKLLDLMDNLKSKINSK